MLYRICNPILFNIRIFYPPTLILLQVFFVFCGLQILILSSVGLQIRRNGNNYFFITSAALFWHLHSLGRRLSGTSGGLRSSLLARPGRSYSKAQGCTAQRQGPARRPCGTTAPPVPFVYITPRCICAQRYPCSAALRYHRTASA